MKRAIGFLVRNWPLKLAALGLAVVLYGGVVLSEDARSWPGQVPIAVVDPPPGGVLLTPPGSVTEIRYRAPLDVAGRLTAESFRATLDLSGLVPQPGGPAVRVPVALVATDPRVRVIDFAPRFVDVQLDSIVSRTVPVTVERGVAPEGLVLGPPQVEPAAVLLRAASTDLAAVHRVVARIAVDGSGLNIDRTVDLEVVDEAGDLVSGVEVMPEEVRVRIDVARDIAYAVVPVVVDVVGAPAEGFRVAGLTVDPATVTVSGEAPAVERLGSIVTEPVDVGGSAADLTQVVDLILPPAIALIGEPEAEVTVRIVPVRASRVLEAGLVLEGARRDRVTSLSTTSVLVTVSGEVAALDDLEAGRSGVMVGEVDVTGLGNGRHEVDVLARVPDGLTLVSVAPRTVVVRIGPPTATPTPGPTPAASPAPTEVTGPPASGSPSGDPAAALATTPRRSVPPSAGPVARATDLAPVPSPLGGS